MSQGANYNLINPFNTGGAVNGPFQQVNGTAAAPSYSFSSASNTGWFYDSANASLAASIAGVEQFQLSNPALGPTLQIGPKSSAGVTLVAVGSNQLNLNYGNGTNNPANLQVYSINGFGATFSNFFIGVSGNPAAGQIILYGTPGGTAAAHMSLNGLDSQTWDYATQGSTMVGPWLRSTNGTAAAPSLSFTASTGTGLFSPAANSLGLSSNGILALTLDASQNATFAQTVKYKAATASKTTAYTVVAADSATVFDNTGAAAGVTFTLPAAAVGLTYTFGTAAAQIITVAPQAADAIGAKAANTSYASAAAKGSCLTVTCTAANYWLITNNNGFT